jgi:hypothetical protein
MEIIGLSHVGRRIHDELIADEAVHEGYRDIKNYRGSADMEAISWLSH